MTNHVKVLLLETRFSARYMVGGIEAGHVVLRLETELFHARADNYFLGDFLEKCDAMARVLRYIARADKKNPREIMVVKAPFDVP